MDDSVFLITAKHVVSLEVTQPHVHIEIISYDETVLNAVHGAIDLPNANLGHVYRAHPRADVCAFKLARLKHGTEGEIELLPEFAMTPGTIRGLMADNVRLFGDAQLANDVYVFGYPISVGMKGQLEPDKPLVRKGCLAGRNSINETLVLDLTIHKGNSGGLAVEVEDLGAQSACRGLGVVTQFVPIFDTMISSLYGADVSNTIIDNAGYTVIEPMDRVLEVTAMF